MRLFLTFIAAMGRVVDGGRGDARELLMDLRSRDGDGRVRFPMLRGPEIGPMWIRMMANPGRAVIDRIDTIPVAVDVQVRRATENLGVATTRGLPLRKARPVIQQTWTNAAQEADIAGPAGIEGTCAALDPALWFFGRHGCGHCEKVDEKVCFGRACDFCVRFGQFSSERPAASVSPPSSRGAALGQRSAECTWPVLTCLATRRSAEEADCRDPALPRPPHAPHTVTAASPQLRSSR